MIMRDNALWIAGAIWLLYAAFVFEWRRHHRCAGPCGKVHTGVRYRTKYRQKLCEYCLMEREFVQFHRGGDEMRWDKERAR